MVYCVTSSTYLFDNDIACIFIAPFLFLTMIILIVLLKRSHRKTDESNLKLKQLELKYRRSSKTLPKADKVNKEKGSVITKVRKEVEQQVLINQRLQDELENGVAAFKTLEKQLKAAQREAKENSFWRDENAALVAKNRALKCELDQLKQQKSKRRRGRRVYATRIKRTIKVCRRNK